MAAANTQRRIRRWYEREQRKVFAMATTMMLGQHQTARNKRRRIDLEDSS
jgi:hypothetical protein